MIDAMALYLFQRRPRCGGKVRQTTADQAFDPVDRALDF
jgi:hypothetical protein